MRFRLAALAALLALTGCHARLPIPGAERVDLSVQPFLATGRSTQGEVARKTVASIKRLDILPYVQTGTGVFRPISSVTGEATDAADPNLVTLSQVAPIDFDRSVTIRNLRARTTYRIFAQAYDEANDLISTADAFSYVEVALSNDNAPQLPVKLPVKLLDTPFAAATSVILSASGALNRLGQVESQLVVLVEGSELPVPNGTLTILPAAFPRTVSLSHLQAQTTYRLIAQAKDHAGAPLTLGSVDIPVHTDDTPLGKAMTLTIPEFPLVARLGS